MDREVTDILAKAKNFYNGHNMEAPKIGFVLVNKRTNTRLFRKTQRYGYTNPLPGTVVDDVITFKER
jgi:hypothetical protein